MDSLSLQQSASTAHKWVKSGPQSNYNSPKLLTTFPNTTLHFIVEIIKKSSQKEKLKIKN